MSNVIGFLERMGQDAQLRHASQNDVEQALTRAQIDPELQVAILAKDQRRIEALLGVSNVCCAFMYDDHEEDDQKQSGTTVSGANRCCFMVCGDDDEDESRLEQCA
ncbi:MAG: hypothetical protein EPN49_11705 [Rhodanobacter sp.]|nr:MAG: hypothetical protein EPN49_11705 [Rhodanobacter sp.]